MLSKNIKFKNFLGKKKSLNIYKVFNELKKNYLNDKIKELSSLNKNYQYNYSKSLINKYKNFKNFKIVGMGGSILGAKAIYKFLNYKIKKN